MRKVETERIARQGWFSVGLLRKVQGVRIRAESCAEDVAQGSMRYCELTLGVLSDKAIGACALFRRKYMAQPLQGERRLG